MSKYRIKTFCDVIDGYSFSSKLYTDEGVKVIRISNVSRGEITDKNPRYYPLNLLEDYEKSIAKESDILVTLTGDVGQVGMIKKEHLPAAINQRVVGIRNVSDELNTKFLFYNLNSEIFENYCIINAQGTAQLNLSILTMMNHKINLPPYNVQQEIAHFLDKKVDKINELIQVQEDAIAKFEEYKQQVISETINFGIEKNNLVDVKYEWIKKMPSHWEIEKVARTTYLKGRIGWQGLKSTEFKTEGPHLVTGTDFNNGYVDWDNCVRVTEQRYEEAKFIQVQEGDLLITKDGTIGKVAIAQNAPEKVSVNSGIFVTRPLHNEYINKYFYYLMLSDVFKEFFQLTLTGNSTILHLYQGVFSQFRYPLPPISEQHEIVDYLDKKTEEINQLIQIKKDKIERLNEYKKSLIYEAVTGKIEVM